MSLETWVGLARNGLCVVLAGYRDGMAHLMRADPGLVRRFPTALHLGDYTPSELAAIARQTAAKRFGLCFATGLEARLASGHGHRHAAAAAEPSARRQEPRHPRAQTRAQKCPSTSRRWS